MNSAQSITCESCGVLIDLDDFYMHMEVSLWKCATCGESDPAYEHFLTEEV